MRRLPWRRILGWSLAAAALYFLGRGIAQNAPAVRQFDWRIDTAQLIASIVLQTAVLAGGVFIWSRVLARFRGADPHYPALLRVWSFSNLARYVPGGIWQFVAAAQLARGAGVPRALLLASLMIHMGLVLVAAALVAVWTLPEVVLGSAAPAGWLMAATAAALLLVHPAVLNVALRVVNRIARREWIAWTASWADGIWLLALQVASWLVYGVAFYLFVDAVVGAPITALLPLAGANALAFTAGYLVVFAPGGLGARELALSALLTPFVPAGVAAVLALLSRLWSIAAEILTGAVAWYVFRRWPPAPADRLRGGANTTDARPDIHSTPSPEHAP